MSDYTERKRRYVHELEAEIERLQKCWTVAQLREWAEGWPRSGVYGNPTETVSAFLDWLEERE